MDVLAAADDHVVDTPGDPEIPVRVDPAHVAREVPAFAQRPGVGVGAVPVPGERLVRAEARDDLTLDTGSDDLVGPDPPLGARRDDTERGVNAGSARAAGLGAHVGMDRKGVDLGRAVVVHEQVGAERLRARLGERRQHRRAGVGELAYRRHVAASQLGRMRELPEERRDQVERGQALARDQLERAGARPVRLADEAAVDRGHAGQRVNAHRVIERHDAQGPLTPGVAALDHVRERAGVVILVRARDALRAARGARRVEDQRRIALGGRSSRHGRTLLIEEIVEDRHVAVRRGLRPVTNEHEPGFAAAAGLEHGAGGR
jgi:hypothetical protein